MKTCASSRSVIRARRPSEREPMRGAGGDGWLIYNGELYNADELRRELRGRGILFRSRSDTEVVLR